MHQIMKLINIREANLHPTNFLQWFLCHTQKKYHNNNHNLFKGQTERRHQYSDAGKIKTNLIDSFTTHDECKHFA